MAVAPFELESWLRQKGVNVRRSNRHEIQCSCCFCNEDHRKPGRLYIQRSDNALYTCFLCGAKGNIRTLMRFFGEEPARRGHDEMRLRIFDSASRYYARQLNMACIRWLVQRGFTHATIERFRLGWAEGGVALYGHLRDQGFGHKEITATGLCVDQHRIQDFFQSRLTIPYLADDKAYMIRGRLVPWVTRDPDVPKYIGPSGSKVSLFNGDAARLGGDVVVAEGELSAMAIVQSGFPAIAVPGAGTWNEGWDADVAKVRRLIVAFDADDAGRAGAEKLRQRFGTRARVIDFGEGDADEYLLAHGAADFKALCDEAVATGSILVTPKQAREAHARSRGFQALKTGIPTLDNLIDPGLLPGQVMTWLARSGSGKTTMMTSVFAQASRIQPDLKILYFSLEQTRSEWFERARRNHGFLNLHIDMPSLDDMTEQWWQDRVRIVDANRVRPDEFEAALHDFVADVGQPPGLVVVDYLGYWASSFDGSRYERTSDAIMDLKRIAKDWEFPVMSPHQTNSSTSASQAPDADQARDSRVVIETSDFVVILHPEDWAAQRPEPEWTWEYTLKLDKSRHGNAGKTMKTQCAPMSLIHVDGHNRSREFVAAKEEVIHHHRGLKWDEAREYIRTGTAPTITRQRSYP